MPVSPAIEARRALVRLLAKTARARRLTVNVNRDSPDKDVQAAFRKVIKYAHPDKGGTDEEMKLLNAAKDKWDKAKRDAGRPRAEEAGASAVVPEAPEYRIRSVSTMLTYQGVADLSQWRDIVAHWSANVRAWSVKHWCATLEANRFTATFHVHVMVQFKKTQDRTSRSFTCAGICPRADVTDLGGHGVCKKKLQESINRGMFYVWADKIGTQRDESGQLCVEGNYAPCWTSARFTYPVKGAWPEDLWKQRKLTHDMYEKYLFETRDGIIGRKRNLDAVREKEKQEAVRQEIAERVQRIRGNPDLYRPFPEILEAQRWLESFSVDALRYAILVVLGTSACGKTEWANSLFRKPLELKIGRLEHFPDKMRSFDRQTHDGLILDDVRDMQFIADNQEKLQGKYNEPIEFGSTPGGTCAYFVDLFRIPIVVTANQSTENLQLLDDHDWLGKAVNRTIIHFEGLGAL